MNEMIYLRVSFLLSPFLPEVIGFAIIAGVHPLSAVFASAVTLLVITFTGGRPAMVSASAGSMALVLAGLIQAHGLSYMLAATILTGFLQFIFRLFRYPQIDALYSQDSDVRIRQCVSHF